jgi:putative endonuclease
MNKSFVYILTNKNSTVLYTGVTSDLPKRIMQHRNKTYDGFSAKYNLTRVVYIEELPNITDAILREKHIKMMSRQRKVELINKVNPKWDDLI